MSKNEEIIRSGYAAAEGGVNDVKTFVSLFTADGVILDVASGTEYRGKDLGRMVDVFATAFPDVHRDIHHVYETSDRGIDVAPNTKSCGHSPKVPAKPLRCCAVPASERAVEPVGSEYPSKYAISVIESVAS